MPSILNRNISSGIAAELDDQYFENTMAYDDGLDFNALWLDLKTEESRLRLKRRWLMNAPLSETDRQKIKKLDPLLDESIPESLLRKDDAYYETIKNFVEGVSGTSTSGKEHEHALFLKKIFKNGTCVKDLRSVLHDMTDEELCYLSEIVTDGSVKFEKTQKVMKRIIKKYLPSYLHRRISVLDHSGIREDLCFSSESFRDSAIQVLDMLEELPSQTLAAMHRKLKGKTGLIKPTLFGDRRTRIKPVLVSPLRIHCMKMLSELDEGNPPPEALAEALSVAGVTLKLLCGHTHIIEFKRFSPKVKDLQNRIAKAIYTVTYVDVSLLEEISKKLDLLSERDVEVLEKYTRVALRNRLIELLAECSDMESIPKGFVEILNDVNNMAYLHIPKNLAETPNDINKAPGSSSSGNTSKVEEEVEFLLCFSAQIKQVMLDLLSEDEDIDQDFATAYMEEEPEDNDVEEEDYTNEFDSSDCGSVTESIGETKPDHSPLSTPKQEPLDFDQECDSFRSNGLSSFSYRNQSFSRNGLLSATSEDQKNKAEPDDSELKTNLKDKGHHMQGQFSNLQQQQQQQQCTAKNKYLSMQRVCDETAMAMQHAIDGILNELAKS